MIGTRSTAGIPGPLPVVLALSVPAGHGHIRPAEALVAAAYGRTDLQCRHQDVLRLVNRVGARCYAALHRRLMSHHPALLGRLYHRLEHSYSRPQGGDSSRWVRLFGGRRLARWLIRAAPDHIVATHCLAGELVSRLIGSGQLDTRLWVVENDFTYYPWWRQPHVAGYFVPSDEVASGLLRHRVAPDRIHRTGVPVQPDLACPPPRQAAAAELGLDPDRFTVTVMSGGGAIGDLEHLAQMLIAHDPELQLVVLAGTNERLRRRLAAHPAASSGRLVPLGFTERVELPLAAADIVITKPGGSTVAELLALGAAMILIRPQPGMEDRNAAWLLARDAALLASDEPALLHHLGALRDPTRRTALAAAARALGRPKAAEEVLNTIAAGARL